MADRARFTEGGWREGAGRVSVVARGGLEVAVTGMLASEGCIGPCFSWHGAKAGKLYIWLGAASRPPQPSHALRARAKSLNHFARVVCGLYGSHDCLPLGR